MTEQLTLDGKTQTEADLTDRQHFALELIRELGPIPSDELGAHMHERRGNHRAKERCQWCAEDGKAIGKELRAKKELGVHERQGEGWYVGRGRRRVVTRLDNRGKPAPAEWPEGF